MELSDLQNAIAKDYAYSALYHIALTLKDVHDKRYYDADDNYRRALCDAKVAVIWSGNGKG